MGLRFWGYFSKSYPQILRTRRFYLLALTLLSGVTVFSINSFAANYNCPAGKECTIGGTDDPATISYRPSPNVTANVFGEAAAFAINSLNDTASISGNGIEYLTKSTDPGYYQKVNNTSTTAKTGLAVLTKADADVAGFTYIGTEKKATAAPNP